MNEQLSDKDLLRALIHRKAARLREEALRGNGALSQDQLESLEHLQRLEKLYATSGPPKRRKRWPMAVLFGATLALVSLLLFARVETTEIELDLSLSELGFRMPKGQVLADVMRLSSLGASGLQKVGLPRGIDEAAPAVLLSTDTGMITLAALALPAATRVWLQTTEIPQHYRLSLKGGKILKGGQPPIQADVLGVINIGLPGKPRAEVHYTSPQTVVLQPGPDVMDLDLGFQHATKDAFSDQLVADSLSFFRVDEHFDQDQSIVRRASTILSGKVYFESLGGQERDLRLGEEIAFTEAKGEIRTLDLQNDHISFAFHGRVEGMTSGVDDHSYSIMPTYLDWLRARHGLALLWGSTLYLFGLILSARRWWRDSK